MLVQMLVVWHWLLVRVIWILERFSDALHSEALAMLYAIRTATQLGCDRVMIETDCVQLKNATTTEDFDLSALGAIFKDIKLQLRVGFADVCVVSCPRTCNRVAHMLAAYGANLGASLCEIWLGHVPNFVEDAVAGDLSSPVM